jgi:hypothetical protein
MRAGDTFKFVLATIEKKHLWVVISDPSLDVADPVVIVNLTTYREGMTNPTCILRPGDHAFVRHPTSVCYEDALDVPNTALESAADDCAVVLQGPLQPSVLERIRRGAAEPSSRIPEACRQILLKQGLIE